MSLLDRLSMAGQRNRYGQRLTPGSRPGSMAAHPEALASTIRITCYDDQEIEEHESCSVEQVQQLLGKRKVTWIDVVGLGSIDVIEEIGNVLGLHRLALADVVNVPQRSKVEAYGDYLFFIAQVPSKENLDDLHQISYFISKNYVLTCQERPGREFRMVRDRLQHKGRPIRESGADYLFYALLDSTVDAYFPKVAMIGDELDVLDEQIDEGSSVKIINRLHHIRRVIRHYRGVVWPLREAIGMIRSTHADEFGDDVAVYMRDIHDHAFQIIETLETFREACNDLRDYYATEVSNRTNEVMKVLTIIATTFIPLSFIAGLYGMNFDTENSPWNMPELHWAFGYPLVLGIMALVTAGQLYYFYRKGWLSRDSAPRRKSQQ